MEYDSTTCFTASPGSPHPPFALEATPRWGNGQWMVVLALTLIAWALLRGLFGESPRHARPTGDPTRVGHCRDCSAAHPGHARFCPQCGRKV